jgi:hypothetical protein
MFQHKGGTMVGRGTFWNLHTGEKEVMKCEGILPGNEQTSYLKAPSIAIVLIGPVIGLFYVMFLPFIGLAMIFMLVTSQLSSMLYEVFGRTAAFGWRPVEAYLMSRRNKKKAKRDKQPSKDAEPKGSERS